MNNFGMRQQDAKSSSAAISSQQNMSSNILPSCMQGRMNEERMDIRISPTLDMPCVAFRGAYNMVHRGLDFVGCKESFMSGSEHPEVNLPRCLPRGLQGKGSFSRRIHAQCPRLCTNTYHLSAGDCGHTGTQCLHQFDRHCSLRTHNK